MSEPRVTSRSRWAPWWAYLVPILALNYLRQIVLPPGEVGDAISVAIAVAIVIAVIAVVTAAHRSRAYRARRS
jgi:hypothetical protein